ncbi:hypothetical protein [Mucilaginibacter boryungensis]|uniref:Uncharacterized protein n=1 Tax=Mucilaginibacter boryungensis TaxID=768480 RepID=A0ABR9XKR3_9SPHI|nr:hypothetical protein [Mucilaginibacter boryungensis]MBE9667792.1 hypothetical protein [Mucilaginibacter boryungensis]
MLKKMMYSGGVVLPKVILINNSSVGSATVDLRLSSDPTTGAGVITADAGEKNTYNLFNFNSLDVKVFVSGDGPYTVIYKDAVSSGSENIYAVPPDDPQTTIFNQTPNIKITIEDAF